MKPMPNPTPEEIESPLFNAIWDAIKSWDVNVPESYSGYCGLNGSHVKIIIDAIAAEKAQTRDWQAIEALLPEIDYILELFSGALHLGRGNKTEPIEYIYPVDLEKAGLILTRLRAAMGEG